MSGAGKELYVRHPSGPNPRGQPHVVCVCVTESTELLLRGLAPHALLDGEAVTQVGSRPEDSPTSGR